MPQHTCTKSYSLHCVAAVPVSHKLVAVTVAVSFRITLMHLHSYYTESSSCPTIAVKSFLTLLVSFVVIFWLSLER